MWPGRTYEYIIYYLKLNVGYLTKCHGCVMILCMLVRKQILLEEKQALELEKLAALYGISFSEAMREGAEMVTKKIKTRKKVEKKLSGTEALLRWAKNPVHGPGDSEYDKYAYDY